jgi:hypothetical protein
MEVGRYRGPLSNGPDLVSSAPRAVPPRPAMSLLMPLRAFGLTHDATMVGPSVIRPIDVEVAAECLDRHAADPHLRHAYNTAAVQPLGSISDPSLKLSQFTSKRRSNTYVPAWPKRTQGAA